MADHRKDDTPDQTAARLAAVVRRQRRRHGVGLVVVDYLQLMRPENPKENRTQQVGLCARRVKLLARQCGVPVLLLCQLNRAVENRGGGKPRLADLRESGSLEQDADTVMILHRPEMYEPGQHEGIIEINIAKQRNGPTGELTLTFLKQFMRFENFAVDTHFGYDA